MNLLTQPIVCRKLFDVEEFAPGWTIADVGVGPAHDPVISMWSLPRKVGSGWRWRAGLLGNAGSGLREVRLPDPINESIGVGKRWDVRPDVGKAWIFMQHGSEQSTVRILDEEGCQIRSLSIGGLPHIQVTDKGEIWARYNDEGVFSGDDHASSGLCCFDQSGSTIYRHNQMIEARYSPDEPEYKTLFISDCYAMNLVSGEEIWTYFSTEFPLVRIVNHQIVAVWDDLPVKGSNGFAIGSGHALFGGSYHDRLLHLVDLASMRAVQLKPLDRDGAQIEYSYWASVGQADTLYLVNEQAIHAVTVSEAIAATSTG